MNALVRSSAPLPYSIPLQGRPICSKSALNLAPLPLRFGNKLRLWIPNTRPSAIPKDAFWITAAQAVALPFVIFLAAIIGGLLLRKNLEFEAMQDVERLRAQGLLKNDSLVNGSLQNAAAKITLAEKSRNRPIREE